MFEVVLVDGIVNDSIDGLCKYRASRERKQTFSIVPKVYFHLPMQR